MHVALTGATGFVGAAVSKSLLESGHSLRLSARSRSGLSTSVRGMEVVEGDLRSSEVRAQLVRGVDAVVHCAAALRTPDRTALQDVNVHMAGEIARVAHSAGVTRFVLLSSTGVYGQQGGELDETSPQRPENPYERSKLGGEKVVARALPPGALTIVRPSNVVGEAHPGRPLLRLLRRLRDGEIVYGRVANTNYVHVDYVAEVVLRSLEANAPEVVIVNDAVSLSEFVSIAREELGVAPAKDYVIPAVTSQVLAAAMERKRHWHPAISRALALFDDTRFISQHRSWARGPSRELEATRRTLERLVRSYRQAELL